MSLKSVLLSKIIKDCNLTVAYAPNGYGNITIKSFAINRPGLILTGFTEYFQNNRIQILGNMEYAYLNSKSYNDAKKALEYLMKLNPPCIVISKDKDVYDYMIALATKYNIPILVSSLNTSDTIDLLIKVLSIELAPCLTLHGVLVEIYGEGILITGESGVGKSETAIELVNRGHSLVADDAVSIKKVGRDTLIGSSPENIRHFIELRGIGIINVSRLFGIGSVKVDEQVTMQIFLENWDVHKNYDRLGVEDSYAEILGVKIPKITIPVKTGRNIANIIEVAVRNTRQKKLGYNAAVELLNRLDNNSK